MLSKGSQSQIACKILSLGLRKTMSMMFCMSIGAMSVGCLSFGKLSLCGGLHTWYLGYPLQSEGRSWHARMNLNGARVSHDAKTSQKSAMSMWMCANVCRSVFRWDFVPKLKGRGERFWDIVAFLGLSVHWADCFAMDFGELKWSGTVHCC